MNQTKQNQSVSNFLEQIGVLENFHFYTSEQLTELDRSTKLYMN